ncbi:phage major capsid protein [Algoriphagus sp. D3-2-R+10]|uniref:phage major capsid protein n=1 Tax=Algoriphagus aurantiacus TaxID=3103948 RepID=UPI002B37D2CA|nr:phage major capsid protein [Algoriphagus sp. D3-2-R+10]MEB2775227.1 phage major capsid protein [Algoriphagus sp. D3-2-R+10]
MKSTELKQLRSQKLISMGELIDTKNAESREFNETEKGSFDKLDGEIRDLDSKIEAAEKEENYKLRMASNAPSVVAKSTEKYSLLGHIEAVRSGKVSGVFAEAQAEGERELREAGVAINSNAAYIPSNYRDFSVTGDSGAKGGNTVSTEAKGIIESLFEGSLLDKLGASKMLGLVGNVKMPKGGKVVSSWVTENGTIAKSDHNIGSVDLTPNRLATRLAVSNQLLVQSSSSVDAYLRKEIEKSIQKALDEKYLENLLAASDTQAVVMGTNGAALTVAKVQEFVSKAGKAEVDIANAKYLINYNVWAALKALAKASGSDKFMLENNLIDGMPFVVSNRVPSNLTKGTGTNLSAMAFGDFSSAIVAGWGAVEIVVDPYTASGDGQTILNLGSYFDLKDSHFEGKSVSKDIVAV